MDLLLRRGSVGCAAIFRRKRDVTVPAQVARWDYKRAQVPWRDGAPARVAVNGGCEYVCVETSAPTGTALG